jgi:hypothetical protein
MSGQPSTLGHRSAERVSARPTSSTAGHRDHRERHASSVDRGEAVVTTPERGSDCVARAAHWSAHFGRGNAERRRHGGGVSADGGSDGCRSHRQIVSVRQLQRSVSMVAPARFDDRGGRETALVVAYPCSANRRAVEEGRTRDCVRRRVRAGPRQHVNRAASSAMH